MLRNYLTVGLRSLTKNRAYAVINLLGLALPIAIGTVAGHTFKVARLNPIHALRYE
jgi:hypothetical protein